ncbi:MAG: division plane positioning ATPase MipZ [Sphingomonas sp.]|jgi:chromosome partitioning protein|nr:division plane positioning ATPase MipZ [Sphingomonas sp.]
MGAELALTIGRLRPVTAPAFPEIYDEDPAVVVRDIASRPRSAGHIIVFANEKGGVGKSTLAFHTCAALAGAGYRVTGFDLDYRQQTLARSLINREATARSLGVALPMPGRGVLRQQSGAMLCQELSRVGWDSDFIVIDVAGHDSPIARRAIALADTLVTPINGSFVDLDLLGRFRADYSKLEANGCFANLVNALRDARAQVGMRPLSWVVMPNRLRQSGSHNEARFEGALEELAAVCGFRVGEGLAERNAYRELFLLGLTHLDLKYIRGIGRSRSAARDELARFVEDLRLPETPLFVRSFGERRA